MLRSMVAILRTTAARKHAALLMLLMVLQMVTGLYAFQGERYGFMQERAAAAEICALDERTPAGTQEDHKPPKQSFTDYDSLFALPCNLPAHEPFSVSQPCYGHPVTIPDVYHDIYVPPQNHA